MGLLSSLFGSNNKGDATRTDTSSSLRDFLSNQIETLGREEKSIHINEITVSYIFHLMMLITKKPVSISDVRHAMREVFTDQSSRIMIENAIGIFQTDNQTQEKLAALFPIAKQDFANGRGEFLIRHTRKASAAIEAMFEEDNDFDPSKIPRWTANDLA